jgi:hypothetical protein
MWLKDVPTHPPKTRLVKIGNRSDEVPQKKTNKNKHHLVAIPEKWEKKKKEPRKKKKIKKNSKKNILKYKIF